MNTASLYQADNAQLLAESCQWMPPPPRDCAAPILVYPLPHELPESPAVVGA
ncbi:hypothetical protein [Pseudoxanthomonas jiangsuensis]|uniref:hypothetical protein n=1 Tax=Pseudoxanthomonas jiangsuensis TaxID=619688 RepID=UPI0013914021|nr:hypothetical protein [Pseudoxanthomonas jiangsuensis]